ncbi:MAG TPA: segregation/condensation protein A [Abditibacteriaceae bacterium]|jgi:segregation and condensation protein A
MTFSPHEDELGEANEKSADENLSADKLAGEDSPLNQPFVRDPERFTGHRVRLRVFEGPLDLLLYLIRAHRTDVCDIPISEVTTQFIEFLSLMEELDLEYAGDFLVTAATLMQIKSRMLLPKHESENEDEMNVEPDDPRQQLVERLLEYQRFQDAADTLKGLRDERADMFSRPPISDPDLVAATQADEDAPEDENAALLLQDISTFDLLRALQKVLDRQATRPVTTIRRDPFTLAERVRDVFKRISSSGDGSSFGALCEDCETRLEVVITFLALLELIARKRILVTQPELFDEIWVRTRERTPESTAEFVA